MLGVWFIKNFYLYKNKMFYTRLGVYSYGSVKIKKVLKTLIFLNSAQYVRGGLVRGGFLVGLGGGYLEKK